MSIVITRSVFCDEPSCSDWYGQTTEPGAVELRRVAKRTGWSRGPYGRGDRCPKHLVAADGGEA
jgi:hypothetical protein